MARIARRLPTLLALLGAVVLGTSGTASAAETVHQERTAYLAQMPPPGSVSICESRDIFLAAGHYDWGVYLEDRSDTNRPDMYLGEGWYHWEICMVPDGDQYLNNSLLDPDNPDWDEVEIGTRYTLGASGDHTWGSFLDPKF
ncbi:hypothetical protein [Streptomyces radicis]|uniref:Uncharacterized protein n=1 Tax=Streptomyces radicis TaxID=1750517 RepID=A0A3A9W5S7_9ACTN|nr:hypothetical protein [Streptomyces radicis]RKN04624.1 hypothetical protein D7319_27875 [Streptomyces radicis]RKN15581.1 hypothetical protein D7318_27280 [Streptomyces radicis]